MKQKLMVLGVLTATLGLSACAGLQEAQAKKAAQLARIQTLQKTAQQLAKGKTGAALYAPTKAMAWLDFALDEHYDEDQTGVVEAAIAEAERNINAINAGETPPTETPIITGSEKVRDDLWQKSAQLKQSTHFDCGAKQLANLDVQLVWTGHEHWESGWSHAKTSSEVADNLAFEAEQAIKNCELAQRDVPSAAPSVTSTVEVIVEKYNFSAQSLFAFNKSGVEYMVLGGKHQLDKIIADIATWQQIDAIEVHGYADEIGSAAYNQTLSEARANAVKNYMGLHGVSANISAFGHGESEPVTDCNSKQARQQRIGCLQGDRRVEISVKGRK